MKERLFGVGLVGLIVLFVAGRAATNHKSSVIDILGKTEAKATVEVPPIETVDPQLQGLGPAIEDEQEPDVRCLQLEQKLNDLDRRLGNYVTTLETRYLPTDTRIAEAHSKWLEELSGQIEQLRKDQLAMMKQSEEPSKTTPEKTQLAKELTFVYGDGCQPCDQWKIGPDREKIAAECHIVPVYVGDLPPESRPESLPAYTLQVDGLRARHRGYLTFQRFKDMERAILEKRRSQ